MTSPNSEEFLQYVSSYRPNSQVINHPTLGDFTVLENAQGHKIVRKVIDAADLSKVDVAIFEKYKELGYDRIVQFLGITENIDGGYEGFAAYYEYFGENLKDEIERKGMEGSKYAELEILKILQNISSSLSFMMASKVHHGEIKSLNIVKVGNDYKVLNPVLFGKFLHLCNDSRPSLPKFHTKIITPEVRNALYRDIIDPVHETYKDDVYGLGLIALDLMTMKVDPSIPVEKRLERSNFLFSNVLVRFVKKMVEKIVSLRLDPVACNQYIERIQLHHGLVSAQRFSKRNRNYSMMGRESFFGEEEKSNSTILDPEESIPVLQKQPSRENRYNRRTESVAPSLTDIRMIEPMRESVRPSGSIANYEDPVYAKKIGDFERRSELGRQSTASTAFSSGPRMTRYDTWKDNNRWSVWDTPRTSGVGALNSDRSGGYETVRTTVNITSSTVHRDSMGNLEHRLYESKVQTGTHDLPINTPVSNIIFNTPSKSTGTESAQSSPEDLIKNAKYVQSEAATPQAAGNEAWKYDLTSDRSHYSRAGTGLTSLKESSYAPEPILAYSQISQVPNYLNTNKEKTEVPTKNLYTPVESSFTYQPNKEFNLIAPSGESKETLPRVSPRFSHSYKESLKFDLPISNDLSQDYQTKPTTQPTLHLDGVSSHNRLNTNSFLVSMNDILPTEIIQNPTMETNEDLEYIEAEQSMDQTFSDPLADASQPKQIDIDSRYSVPGNYSSTNYTTDFNITKEEIQPERKTLAPQTYSNSASQQEFKYFSSYQPSQSYESGFQSKIVKTTTEKLSDGSVYEGEMLGYMKHGKGKLTYPDGKYYEGEWRVGQINGIGKLSSANGFVIYDGQWQDAMYHGRGLQNNSYPIVRGSIGLPVFNKEEGSWIKYSGSFRNNQWEGFGELFLANGDKYVGEFRKDALNGKGKYMKADGKVWEGQWANNSFVQE